MTDEERIEGLEARLNTYKARSDYKRVSEWYWRRSLEASNLKDKGAVLRGLLVAVGVLSCVCFLFWTGETAGRLTFAVLAVISLTGYGLLKHRHSKLMSDEDIITAMTDEAVGYSLTPEQREWHADMKETESLLTAERDAAHVRQAATSNEIAPKPRAQTNASVKRVPMPPRNSYQTGMSEERRQYLASHVPPELRGGTRPVVNTAQYAKQLNKRNPAICPKCGSSNTEYLGKKGGVSTGRMVAGAAIGAAVGGGVGELAGAAVGATTGKKKEMLCRDCGHRWEFK